MHDFTITRSIDLNVSHGSFTDKDAESRFTCNFQLHYSNGIFLFFNVKWKIYSLISIENKQQNIIALRHKNEESRKRARACVCSMVWLPSLLLRPCSLCVYIECATAVSANNFISIQTGAKPIIIYDMLVPNIDYLHFASDAPHYFIRLLIKTKFGRFHRWYYVLGCEYLRFFSFWMLSKLRDVLVFMVRFIWCNFNFNKTL